MVHVLVLDDEPDLEDLINQYFKRQKKSKHFKFEFALNGVDAQKILRESENVQIIISDIRMPDMDGLELLKVNQEMYPEIETILISGYNDIQNIRTAMNLGAFDFLVKPLDLKDLETTIEKTFEHIKNKRAVRELKRKNGYAVFEPSTGKKKG